MTPIEPVARRAAEVTNRGRWRMRFVGQQTLTAVIGMAVAGAGQATHAQSARPPKPAFATAVASSDSLDFFGAVESPDGRWAIFSSAVRGGPTNLWVMPARGGTPRRLTEGNHTDSRPTWFPSGRRIAFMSSRVRGIMASDFDPVAGRLTGELKRVSIEEALWLDVSPDGKHIAYMAGNRLRVIPSSGGTALTILDHSAAGSPILASPKFSADGRDVYVSTRGQGGSTLAKLLRVPVNGGEATTAFVGPSDAVFWGVVADPAKDRVMIATQRGTWILTMRGDTIGLLPTQDGAMATTFSWDGRRLVKSTGIGNTVVRLVPTAGGQSLDFTPGEGNDWPVAWSADATQLYSYVGDSTPARTKPGLMVSAVNGGERRFIPFAPSDTLYKWRHWRQMLVFGNGRYWAFTPRLPQPTLPLALYDTQTRTIREVTRNAVLIVFSGGGLRVGGPELHYLEQRGAGQELRAVRGNGESRVLHATSRLRAPWLIALHGDRVALGEHVGDSTVLYVARAMAHEQRLTAVRGKVAEIVWSPDGKTLAALVNPPQPGTRAKSNVMFVGITKKGVVSQALRFVPIEFGWELAWLADGQAVTLLEEGGGGTTTRVLRVPLAPNGQPTSLTPNERRTFWGQYPSPDGRYAAIPVERFGASTLWNIDVDSAAKAWRAKKGDR
jgi:Tol biopolymer transport system component